VKSVVRAAKQKAMDKWELGKGFLNKSKSILKRARSDGSKNVKEAD